MDKQKEIVLQHNAITTARYDISATEKNIVYMLLTKLQEDDPIDKKYIVRVQELMSVTGHIIDYKQFKVATERLIGRVLTIKEEHGFLQVSIIYSARYLLDSGTIELRVDPTIRPYLFALKSNFTSFNAKMAIKLRSKHSKRIYEMLSQYKDTGIMKVSIHELKGRLDLINVVSKKEKYKKHSMFTQKVLEVAKKELSNKTDIEFVYTFQKIGRKYSDIEFKIKKNSSKKVRKDGLLALANSEFPPHMADMIERMRSKFNLSPWQVKLIVENVSEQEIGRTLYGISVKMSDNEIRSVGAFTAQTFENKYRLGLMGKKHNS